MRLPELPKASEQVEFLYSVVLPFEQDACLIWPYGKDSNGYGSVYIDGKFYYLHRFVCEIANGKPPSAKHHAAHRCGNPSCCARKHLSWKTASKNAMDKVLHGTHSRGNKNKQCRLSEHQVRDIRSLRGKLSEERIAVNFGVSRGTIACIMQRRTWAWLDP